MGFLKDLFNRPEPRRAARDTTDAELNAIFIPLRDRVCNFKEQTNVSWTHIVPAVQKISVRLLVQARGLESARRFYEYAMHQIDANQRIPSGSILGYSKAPVAPERLAELNAMLWDIANDMIAKGHPVEHVAQAFGGFAIMTAEQVAGGDKFFITAVLAESYRELKSDSYGR